MHDQGSLRLPPATHYFRCLVLVTIVPDKLIGGWRMPEGSERHLWSYLARILVQEHITERTLPSNSVLRSSPFGASLAVSCINASAPSRKQYSKAFGNLNCQPWGSLKFFMPRCLPPSPGQGVLVERRCWRWVEVALPRAQGAAKGAWEAALALHTCRRSLRSFKTLDCMHLEELQTKTRLLHYRHLVSKNSKPRNPRQHTFREA